jgi:hypothetical protein
MNKLLQEEELDNWKHDEYASGIIGRLVAELKQMKENYIDAEGRYSACYSQLTKVQAQLSDCRRRKAAYESRAI